MKRNIILCDLDHTVSNAFCRDHMIGNVSWDEYHSAAPDDEPLHDIVNLLEALSLQGYIIIGITARPAKWRRMTMDWLVKHGVQMDEILMRPDEAYHPSPEMKTNLVLGRFGSNFKEHIAFLLEDRDDVCAAFRDQGITVLQVHGRQK